MFSFLPNFLVKTQNPTLQDKCFHKFMIPSLKDLVVDRVREMLLSIARTIKLYLSRTEQCHPASSIFISAEKRSACQGILFHFLLWSVISEAYRSPSDSTQAAVTVRAYQVTNKHFLTLQEKL